MRHFTTEALVIYRRNYGEADRFFTLFSKEYGKISALAKGVRKINSSFGGKLEILNQVRLEIYVSSAGRQTITDVTSINPFLDLKSHPDPLQYALLACKYVGKLMPEEESFSRFYYDYVELLHCLSDQTSNNTLLTNALLVKIFQALGDLQPLYLCLYCRKKCQDQPYMFDYMHKGLVCEECYASHKDEVEGFRLNFESIKLLSFLQRAKMEDIRRVRAQDEHFVVLKQILNSLLPDYCPLDPLLQPHSEKSVFYTSTPG